ncbi:MAG: HmuY family protein [Bacteroidales bacterium]|nr:HmuY family protein [Bacteroidales bacterium]
MKNILIIILLLPVLFIACEKDNGPEAPEIIADSAIMGANYENDIYYSLANGEIAQVNRSNWDFGFYTNAWSSSIIINDGAGVELYVLSTDTTTWNDAADTTGLYTWPKLYNSSSDWEIGAFSANMTGHPDYGWGVYNNQTHDLNGSTIYVIKFADGAAKKIFIKNKISVENIYNFRVADLDGSNQHWETLNCNQYATKDYVYYSLSGVTLVDREPVSDSWDLLFTKYIDETIQYPVTGVLVKKSVQVAKVDIPDAQLSDTLTYPFIEAKDAIGYDWKEINMTTYLYDILPDLTYFVKTEDQSVYKLQFTDFIGSSEGKFKFEKTKLK